VNKDYIKTDLLKPVF